MTFLAILAVAALLEFARRVRRERRLQQAARLEAEALIRRRREERGDWFAGLVEVEAPDVLVTPRGVELELGEALGYEDALVFLAELETLG